MNWDYYSQYMENIKFMFQTTNQKCLVAKTNPSDLPTGPAIAPVSQCCVSPPSFARAVAVARCDASSGGLSTTCADGALAMHGVGIGDFIWVNYHISLT